jgi:hypothetical protein
MHGFGAMCLLYCRFAYRKDNKKIDDREGSRLLSKFAQLPINVFQKRMQKGRARGVEEPYEK